MKKGLKILILIHPELNPLKVGLSRAKHVDSPCKTEAFVYSTLKRMGHLPEFLELEHNLDPLMTRIGKGNIDLVFNLLEELSGQAKFDFHAVSYLESRGIKFTGCGPRALILTRDKALSKLVVRSLGFGTPEFQVVSSVDELSADNISYPAFVKLNNEDASLGLSQSNRVSDRKSLRRVCARMLKEFNGPLIVEEFISGQDVSIALIGNQNPQVLPTRILSLPDADWIAGEAVKFDSTVRASFSIRSQGLRWTSKKERDQFESMAISIYKGLRMRGYGRIDFRRTPNGQFYFLEANANPDLAKDEDFGLSAKAAGLTYSHVIEQILKHGCT